jgi:hypothetical protein
MFSRECTENKLLAEFLLKPVLCGFARCTVRVGYGGLLQALSCCGCGVTAAGFLGGWSLESEVSAGFFWFFV